MKIGIDARFLSHPQPGGFKTYTQNLVTSLADIDRDNEYVLYTDRPSSYTTQLSSRPNVAIQVVRGSLPIIGMPWREQVRLPLQAQRDRLDLLHSPCLTAPLQLGCPSIVTIHDTIWLSPARFARPKGSGKRTLMQWYYQLVPRLAARRAAGIITVSQASKNAIVQDLGIAPERITITYEAASSVYRRVSDQQRINVVRQRYGLHSQFILAIGSADPRKNLSTLLQAYALLRADLQQRYPLTIVWTHSYLALEMTKLAAELGIAERLRFLEHVSDEDLATLYSTATAFVFPSLYEGFGLPVLEAMSCGTPIVAANNSSIPEICGDAAILAAAEDRDAIAGALTQLLTDSTLQEKLAARGHQRAAGFSWESCARETRTLYAAILSATFSSRSSSFG